MPRRNIEKLDLNIIRGETSLVERQTYIAGLALTAADLNMFQVDGQLKKLNDTYEHMLSTVICAESDEVIRDWRSSGGGVESTGPGSDRGRFNGFELFDRSMLVTDTFKFLTSDKRRLDVCLVLMPPRPGIDVARDPEYAYADVETKSLLPLRLIGRPVFIQQT